MFEKHKEATDPEVKKQIYVKIDSLSQEAAKYAVANEYDKSVNMLGAKYTNAFTNYEATAYMNDIPSNELNRWLKLESERFQDPVFRLFHTELETVYEEFNMLSHFFFRFKCKLRNIIIGFKCLQKTNLINHLAQWVAR